MTTETELRERIAELEAALHQISNWANAHPTSIFEPPNFARMREILEVNGMPNALDQAHGTWSRQLFSGVREILESVDPATRNNDDD